MKTTEINNQATGVLSVKKRIITSRMTNVSRGKSAPTTTEWTAVARTTTEWTKS